MTCYAASAIFSVKTSEKPECTGTYRTAEPYRYALLTPVRTGIPVFCCTSSPFIFFSLGTDHWIQSYGLISGFSFLLILGDVPTANYFPFTEVHVCTFSTSPYVGRLPTSSFKQGWSLRPRLPRYAGTSSLQFIRVVSAPQVNLWSRLLPITEFPCRSAHN